MPPLYTAPNPQQRWPWGMLRLGTWLLPSFLAMALAGLLLAALVTTTAAVVQGRNPLVPLALGAIGAVLFLAQGLWRSRYRGLEQHAVLPSLLLLFSAWTVLLLTAHVPLLPTLDLLSLGLGVQLGIGRLGCTLAGCCYGLPASWGLRLPADSDLAPDGVRRLPVTLLEAGGWLLIACGCALALAAAPPGTAVALLLLLYGLLRSALEPLRGDPVRRWGGLRPAQLQAYLCTVAGLCLAWQLRLRQGPTFLSAAEPVPYGELALVLLGLMASALLLVRRELWGGGVRQLTVERQHGLERFARWLLEHPPQRQVRVHSLGDLQLGICRLGWDGAREWQISVRRQHPPLCRAEAEWTLQVIAAQLNGPWAPTPLVVAWSEGHYFINLPGPHRTREGPGDTQHLPLQTSDYFQPLLPDQSEARNACTGDDCSIRNDKE